MLQELEGVWGQTPKCFSASWGSMFSAGKDNHPQLRLLLVYLVHLSPASMPAILAHLLVQLLLKVQ